MARRKRRGYHPAMGRTRRDGVDEEVRALTRRFADELARLVRGRIDAAVGAEVADVLSRALQGGAARVAAGVADRRLGRRPVPVRCPAPGCRRTGIRAKQNFCAPHAESLGEAERARLRDAQRARTRPPRRRPRP
jgi:hypothetical protein